MTPKQIELARHALGFREEVRKSYRNHFCAGDDHPDFPDWLALVEAGDALAHRPPGFDGKYHIFHLTRQGAEKVLLPGERLDPEDFPGWSTDGIGA